MIPYSQYQGGIPPFLKMPGEGGAYEGLKQQIKTLLDRPTTEMELAALLKNIAKAIPPIAAGAATVTGWAVPAKRIGAEIGWRIEEKKAGKRLRPQEPSFKEYAKYIPGALKEAPAAWAKETLGTLGGLAGSTGNVLSRIKKKLKK